MEKEYRLVRARGKDILKSPGMISEKKFIQHGRVTVYKHSVSVAVMCLMLAHKFNIEVDEASLVRGALLHDYFLYDWHVADPSHRLHGFFHARKALKNAERDFELNAIERNMIECHMFPLNLVLPLYPESVILCVADKLCASMEIVRNVKEKFVKD